MPKLNLRTAQRIKVDAGEVFALKGAGFEWFGRAILDVNGADVAYFTRADVDCVQLNFNTNGTIRSSRPVTIEFGGMSGGGGSGGRGGNTSNRGGGAGAGRYVPLSGVSLLAGLSTLTIGAGGAQNIVGNTNGNAGSVTTLTMVSSTITAPGGGYGSANLTNANAGPGGSGGGARGAVDTASVGAPGDAVAGMPISGLGNPGGSAHLDASELLRSSGGGGGAGGPGGNGASGVAGLGGPGVLLDWMAIPETVCRGGDGITGNTATSNTSPVGRGSGSSGNNSLGVTAGANGFVTLVFKASDVVLA